jgi:RNA polymerase sigma-70 factor (ECF subfamily)
MHGDGTWKDQGDDAGGVISLVKEALGGDRPSFERLITIHQEGIFRMVYARMQSRADAEDVVQDVFLSAYRNLASLREPELFKAWLYRIALNRVRDFMRKRKLMSLFGFTSKEADEDYPDSGPDGFDHLAARRFWSRVNDFLTSLPPLQREVFRLRFIDDLGIHEIAAALGRNESTVKTHLYRALDKFRTEGSQYGLCPQEEP